MPSKDRRRVRLERGSQAQAGAPAGARTRRAPAPHAGWPGTQLNSGSVTFYVAVYVSISVTTCIASAVQALVLYSGGMNASRTLYKKMTYAVLRAPLRWVDTVPTGQILNAFISDFNTIDQRLALDFGFLLEFFFRLVIISAAR